MYFYMLEGLINLYHTTNILSLHEGDKELQNVISWWLILCRKHIELSLYNSLCILLTCFYLMCDLMNDEGRFSVLIGNPHYLIKATRAKIFSNFVPKPVGVNVLTIWLASDLLSSGFEMQVEWLIKAHFIEFSLFASLGDFTNQYKYETSHQKPRKH